MQSSLVVASAATVFAIASLAPTARGAATAMSKSVWQILNSPQAVARQRFEWPEAGVMNSIDPTRWGGRWGTTLQAEEDEPNSALPKLELALSRYDLRPLLDRFVGRTLQFGHSAQVTLITKQFLLALDVWATGAQLAVTPTSLTGGTISVGGVF